MTTRLKLLHATFISSLALSSADLSAQSMTEVLSRLKGSTETSRTNALSELLTIGRTKNVAICSPSASPQVRAGLISALEAENALVYAPGSSHSEAETEFYASLVGCVAALRDPAALNALIGAISTGWMAMNGVIALGEAAVPSIVRLMEPSSRNSSARHAATLVAGKLLTLQEPAALSSNGVSALRKELLGALGDSDRFIRRAAIESLTPFSDDEVRTRIARLAATDPVVTLMRPGERHFPVRETARAWLRQDSLKAANKTQ